MRAIRRAIRRATVDAILAAAAQVFARHGYAAATTNRIAERAGVSIGSLYEYFSNKDALLVAILEAHIQEGEAILAARIVVQTVEALVHNLILHDARTVDVQTRVDEIVALLVAYLTTAV